MCIYIWREVLEDFVAGNFIEIKRELKWSLEFLASTLGFGKQKKKHSYYPYNRKDRLTTNLRFIKPI
jgi:hypothetical protein